jgi:hypothetical protein
MSMQSADAMPTAAHAAGKVFLLVGNSALALALRRRRVVSALAR